MGWERREWRAVEWPWCVSTGRFWRSSWGRGRAEWLRVRRVLALVREARIWVVRQGG